MRRPLVALALISLTCLCCAAAISNNNNNTNQLLGNVVEPKAVYGPVVFVPGVGGSQLDAKLNRTQRTHPMCRSHTNWFNIWLNVNLLNPIALKCVSENLRLEYNRTSKLTQNPEGVQIRTHAFGSLESVEYLDRAVHLPGTTYFRTISSALESALGLEANENMFGAGYDFRKAPNELDEHLANLTKLIERTYLANNYKPVTLICHSMGCLNTVYLLNRKAQNWKDVYVKRLIALAAPWRGSFKALSSMLLGDNLGMPFINDDKLRPLQITFPSLMYLMPQQSTFDRASGSKSQRVLVETASKAYKFDNLDELFRDSKMDDQFEMWLNVRNYTRDLQAPNVELWCLYGVGVATPTKVVFEGELLESRSTQVKSGDGDGTVNLESSLACADFAGGDGDRYQVHLRPFKAMSHVGMLRSKEVAAYIVEHIFKSERI